MRGRNKFPDAPILSCPLSIKKRGIMLLEVLIAFALVVLCVLPLIYPHVFILKSERQFIDTVELDHAVNLLYGDILKKLYRNEISFEDIEEKRVFPIDESRLRDLKLARELPFNGVFQFSILKRKPKPPDDRLYLVSLHFSFTPKNVSKQALGETKTLNYTYEIFIEKREHVVPAGPNEDKEAVNSEDEEEGDLASGNLKDINSWDNK